LIQFSFQEPSGWHVVYARPGADHLAAKAIKEGGFEVFAPVERFFVVRRGRKVQSERPLFPRYLFVKFNAELDDWENILGFDGVDRIMCRNDAVSFVPIRVPSSSIERLMFAQQAGIFDRTMEPTFRGGDLVEILDGAFRGFIAKVKATTASKRVKLLFDFLGQETPTEISACDVRKVG
jgi:transcriptional antiterminator RfaH